MAGLQAADIDRMKAIHVFVGTHRFQQRLGLNMGRQGQLNQDAVDILTSIQMPDQCQHLLGSDRLRRSDQLAEKPQRLAGLDLAAHINLRGRNMPYQHCRQPGPYALERQPLYFRPDLRLDFSGDRGSIQNFSHAPSLLLRSW